MVNPMSLADRTVIVTGAGQGIGLAVADLVGQLGGNAVIVAASFITGQRISANGGMQMAG